MVTFIHEHIFMKYKDKIFTSGSLNKEVISRYIESFGEIRLVTRCKHIEDEVYGIDPSNIKQTQFVCVPNFKSPKKILNYFKAKSIIKREVKEAEHLVLRTGTFANIAARYAKKYNKTYLVEVVGCAWDANWNYNILGKILAPFSFLAQKKTVKKADYAIYVTEEFLQNRYPTNGFTTNCSNVSLNEFNENTLYTRLNKINQMEKKDKIIIGTTAAVDVKYKGQQYIIEALGKLKERGICNFEYQIVGGGDQTYLRFVARKYGVSDQVKFLGALPHKQVFDWLDEIDLYAQPSKQEGLPRALIEAMSKAIPSFGAKTAGIPELLEKEVIFSNKKNNIEEIISVLLSFSQSKMLDQAKKNYKVSQKYAKNTIENRRINFFKKYRNNV